MENNYKLALDSLRSVGTDNTFAHSKLGKQITDLANALLKAQFIIDKHMISKKSAIYLLEDACSNLNYTSLSPFSKSAHDCIHEARSLLEDSDLDLDKHLYVLSDIMKIIDTESLDPESEKILYGNLWKLYTDDKKEER